MSAIIDYMQLCRLCLVKDKVNVPIFGDTSDVRQIFLKISACLPVKVSQDDNLPKNICDACLYKVDLLYQFWNTTVNAEKQLIQWLSEIGVDVNIKNSSPPPLRLMPQSHAHPHSMPETIILKEERLDTETRSVENSDENYQIENQQMYNEYEMPYQPQVNMTVGAPTDFTQAAETPAEEDVKVPQEKSQPTQPTPAKRRGRPPKQKTPPSAIKATPAPTKVVATPALPPPTITNSKRRSSAAAAAAAVAAAAADVSSDESDIDDRLGADDTDDEDMDMTIAKEEADSEDEEYVDNPESLEPTTFVGVPSTSACDSEQPGPSGLGGGSTTGKSSSALPANAANESGPLLQPMMPAPGYQIIGYVPINVLLNRYCCKTCGEKFITEGRLRSHKQKHIPCDKPCKLCGKLFKRNYALNLHIKRVHEGIRDEHDCDLCGDKFSSKNSLIKHQRKHNKDYIAKCSECDKKFYTNVSYQHHINAVHRGVRHICFPCNKAFNDFHYLKIHQREKHDPYYKPEDRSCPICGKIYASKSGFKRHVQDHTNLHNFICDICGKILTTNSSLIHHKMIHSGTKPFICQTCGKAFSKFNVLKTHQLTHTKEKPHKCNICGKRFSQRSPLTIHMRYHTGERPYACEICKNTFVSKNLLKNHSKKHGTPLSEMNK